MTEIIESVIFEGTLRRDTETSDWKVIPEGNWNDVVIFNA